MKSIYLAAAVLALGSTVPAAAVTNLIINGSFETGDFAGFQHLNLPTQDGPAVVIAYNQAGGYPTGAFGEAVPTANTATNSPDAAGNYGAYFSSDHATNETLQQLTYLGVGNYEIGFSAYLTHNGYNNPVDASFSGEIIGTPVTSFNASQETAGVWKVYSGVAQVTRAGYYNTQFVFNSNGYPAKDVVFDQVYATATNKAATVVIPATPTAVPEPEMWAMLVVGFGLTGFAVRRRKITVAA